MLRGVHETSASGEGADGCVVRHFAGVRHGAKRDEDRFSVCSVLPGMASTTLAVVLDGHGPRGVSQGGNVAERAAVQLPELFLGESKRLMQSPEHADDAGVMMGEALARSFAAFQRTHEQQYEKHVMSAVEMQRAEFKRTTGTDAPEIYPAEGGSTATALAIRGGALACAWVGDSRAVMASDADERTSTTGKLCARDLTVDHSASTNEKERQRVVDRGGSIAGPYVSHQHVEGLIQVTRSLGDVGYHRDDVLSADPEVVVVSPVSPLARFVIVASDGVWAVLSSNEAVDLVHTSLLSSGYYETKRPSAHEAHRSVLAACEDLASLAMARAREGGGTDDVSAVLLTLAPAVSPRRGRAIPGSRPEGVVL